MSDYICGTCKYKSTKDCYEYQNNGKFNGYFINGHATCDGWTDPDEPELTEQEKDDIRGDREAHRIMVEGRERL